MHLKPYPAKWEPDSERRPSLTPVSGKRSAGAAWRSIFIYTSIINTHRTRTISETLWHFPPNSMAVVGRIQLFTVDRALMSLLRI